MPQQPFSSFPNATSADFGLNVIRDNPALAHRIMLLIAKYGEIETQMASVFAYLLGINAPTGILLYNSLVGIAYAQKKLVDAVIQEFDLTQELKDILAAVQSWAKGCSKVRNDFAHNTLGTSKDIPESILVVSHNRSLRDYGAQAHFLGLLRRHQQEGKAAPPRPDLWRCDDMTPEDTKGITVYRYTDIEEHIADMDALREAIQKLQTHLRIPPPGKYHHRSLHWLKTQPRLQQALASAAARRARSASDDTPAS